MKSIGKFIVLSAVLIMGIFLLPENSRAAENPCLVLAQCQVPAPTVLNLDTQPTFYPEEVVIAGVSWNETKVDVYIDGMFNGRATLRTDESGVGDFFWRPFLKLEPGVHSVYTVARNFTEKERSFQSPTQSFTVVARPKPVAPVKPVSNEPITVPEPFIPDGKGEIPVESEELDEIEEDMEEEELEPLIEDMAEEAEEDSGEQSGGGITVADKETGEITVKNKENEGKVDIAPKEEGHVDVIEGGQITGGVMEDNELTVSDLQKTADRNEIWQEFFSGAKNGDRAGGGFSGKVQNRIIGLILLAIIILATAIHHFVTQRPRRTDEQLKNADDTIPSDTSKDSDDILDGKL
ncbi:MAG: hypothetical protein NUV82_00120 [Candidatus Komeilibacteria bacterium]|nr:hypothetical protein [Candidatus Komeilibacteria bacterium]